MKPPNAMCWMDENGVVYRDRKIERHGMYEEIDYIDVKQAIWMRDNWLRRINSGKLSDSSCRAAQMCADDIDFLIRGGRVEGD